MQHIKKNLYLWLVEFSSVCFSAFFNLCTVNMYYFCNPKKNVFCFFFDTLETAREPKIE